MKADMLARVERLEKLADYREAEDARAAAARPGAPVDQILISHGAWLISPYTASHPWPKFVTPVVMGRSWAWDELAGSGDWPPLFVDWARASLGLDPANPKSAGITDWFVPRPEQLGDPKAWPARGSDPEFAGWLVGYVTTVYPYFWGWTFAGAAENGPYECADGTRETTRRVLSCISLLAGAAVRRLAALPSAKWFPPEAPVLRAWIAALGDLLTAYKAEVDRALAALPEGDEDLDPARLEFLATWHAPWDSELRFRLELPGETREEVLSRGRAENALAEAKETPTTARR